MLVSILIVIILIIEIRQIYLKCIKKYGEIETSKIVIAACLGLLGSTVSSNLSIIIDGIVTLVSGG